MIFLDLALWRTWTIDLHPDIYRCEFFCGSGPDHFLAFFFLEAAILGLQVDPSPAVLMPFDSLYVVNVLFEVWKIFLDGVFEAYAAIHLLPLQIGQNEDRECCLLKGDPIYDNNRTLDGLMTVPRVADFLGRWAWRRPRRTNNCMSVHLPSHW